MGTRDELFWKRGQWKAYDRKRVSLSTHNQIDLYSIEGGAPLRQIHRRSRRSTKLYLHGPVRPFDTKQPESYCNNKKRENEEDDYFRLLTRGVAGPATAVCIPPPTHGSAILTYLAQY